MREAKDINWEYNEDQGSYYGSLDDSKIPVIIIDVSNDLSSYKIRTFFDKSVQFDEKIFTDLKKAKNKAKKLLQKRVNEIEKLLNYYAK